MRSHGAVQKRLLDQEGSHSVNGTGSSGIHVARCALWRQPVPEVVNDVMRRWLSVTRYWTVDMVGEKDRTMCT